MEKENEKEKEYKCENCNFLTYKKVNYERHLKTEKHITGIRKKRSDKKENKCEVCDNIYSSRRSLNEHKLNKHSNKKEKEEKYKYYCKECNVGNIYEINYKEHIKSEKHKRMMLE